MSKRYNSLTTSRLLVSALVCIFSVSVSHAKQYDAVVELRADAVVSVPIEGIVQAVVVSPGQRVSRGDVLLQLNPHTYQLKLKKAQAMLDAVKPVHKDALREKNDALALFEQTVLSEVELQAALIAFDKAAAQLKQAKAELGLAQWALGWTTVKAPFDAYVITMQVLPGQMIAGDGRSEPLLQLASAQQRAAVTRVSPSEVVDFSLGSEVSVTIEGKKYAARISQISQSAGVVGVYEVIAIFDTADSPISPGSKASIETP